VSEKESRDSLWSFTVYTVCRLCGCFDHHQYLLFKFVSMERYSGTSMLMKKHFRDLHTFDLLNVLTPIIFKVTTFSIGLTVFRIVNQQIITYYTDILNAESICFAFIARTFLT